MNTPARLPCSSSSSSLHDLTMKPPLPHNSCSSASTTMPRLLPAAVVLRLYRLSFVDCCFFVVVISAVVAPLPLTVRCVSSATIFLQTVTPPPPPLHPASCQPSLSSTFAAAHMLIVVFCHCCQHCCSPSATNRRPHLFSRRCPPPHPPSSSTSSYHHP
jgi:hypothetical protein